MDKKRIAQELIGIVGSEGVVIDPEELVVYETDGLTVFKATPGIATLPGSKEEVAEVVKVCHREKIPLVARGAGTGLSGGALPLEGGVLIGLNRMTRILEIDDENQRAVVEPGTVNIWLQNALAPRGYAYAPDPASQTACTIGGNVAENAGGPHTLKYGVTTNHVLGLEVILPNGEVVQLGGKTWDPPGYDLVGIFVGSEGTLGIATRIILRIMPKPEAAKTLMGIFETIEDASNAVSGIVARGIIPVALEMMDRHSIQAVEKGVRAGYPLDAGAVLLIEVDGPKDEVEALVDPILEVLRENHVREIRVARDEKERLLLWKGRKAAAAAIGQISPEYYLHDAVVPRTKLPLIMKFIEGLSQRYGLRVANLFHAGDGNLHPLILYDSRNEGELSKAEAMGVEILKACIEMGGSITGEHGVGLEKRDFMPLMYTEDDLEAMLKVKKVFDPDGLLNPGKIFPPAVSHQSPVPTSSPLRQGSGAGVQGSEVRSRRSEDKGWLLIPDPRIPTPRFSEEVLVQRLGDLIGMGHVVAGPGISVYAIDGKVPKAVVFPGSVEEVSAIMAFASAENLAVTPWGSGTKRAFGNIPKQVDLILALSRLNRTVDHEPKDLTATFQAGISLREAQMVLGRNGQFIALDPPFADLATIGGILATNASGPRRLRYGTSRDHVLALRVVHADGLVTKAGAKVVKTVAGYDMNKLYIGSLGTLGIIVEATFKLYPVPDVEKTYLVPFPSIDLAQAVVARILDAPLVPSAVELLNPEASRRIAEKIGLPWPKGSYGLATAFGSVRREAVDAQLGTVRHLCHEISNVKFEISKGHVLDGQVHDTFWRAARDFTLDGLQVVLKASILLTKVAEAVRLGEEVAVKQGLGLGVVSEAGSGIIRYYLTDDAASPERFQEGVAKAVRKLRAFAQEAQGSLVILEAPPEVKSRVGVWGPALSKAEGPASSLMQGLKRAFDPQRILNPGRFVGGI